MSGWHEVELLCPICEEWKRTGATTTRENFESTAPAVLGGQVVLSCGHRVDADDYKLRLGVRIRGMRQ
jgi:hypothetical protein